MDSEEIDSSPVDFEDQAPIEIRRFEDKARIEEPDSNDRVPPTKRIVPKFIISDNQSEVFCVRFSPENNYIAAGCGDGSIKVYNTGTGRLAYQLSSGSSDMPTTCLRWRPQTSTSKTKNVLISVNADGMVQHWHITSGKCLHSINDPENQLYAIDYRDDGAFFATAGKDKVIRVYDEATKSLAATLTGGGSATPGHSNRVFSLKFNPADSNVIVTGGWDNTIQIWDIRMQHAVRSIYGPHICGDSVDIQNDVVLSGSWRPEEQLQLWDYRSGDIIETIKWRHGIGSSTEPCLLYAAQFSKGSADMIVAGGSGSNEAKIFDRTRGNRPFGTIAGMTRACYTVDFSADNKMVSVAGGDGTIRILEIQQLEGKKK
eukprot:GILK01002326.1.p1 GENE.GILK01002326.1~~GILK01002326.1.p1  ORF type:complete len:393 (+),score=63.42 GILK01002326.1:66-1181(+)